MPYIITTTTYPAGSPMPSGQTKRAVELLDEASAWVDERVAAPFYARQDGTGKELPPRYFELSQAARDLPEEGGMIGPLPNGSMIEVKHYSEPEFRVEVCTDVPKAIDVRMELKDVVEAFNKAAA